MKSSQLDLFFSVCCFIGALTLSNAQASEDAATIRMLIAAQRALMESFPRGALTAVIDDRYALKKAEASVVWSNENYFCQAATEEWISSPDPEQTKARFVYIRTRNRWDYYFPDSGLLQRITDGRASGWSQLQLAPREQWFNMSFAGQITYLDRLEQLLKPHSDFTYTVHDVGDGTIRLESQHNSNWDRAITIFSMKHGGAVLSDEVIPIDSRAQVRSRSLYTWLPTSNGSWRLETYKYQQTKATDEDFSDERAVDIRVTDFDIDPRIPGNRFEISSLGLPSGTWVEELGANERRYRIGGNSKPEAGITEEKFRELAEELSGSKLGAKNK